jgi:phage shock protein C
MTTMRLERTQDKVIGGVCGGIAKYFGWDAAIVRLVYVILSVASIGFPGVLVYLILWIVMPEEY